MSNADITNRLARSLKTVSNHVSNILNCFVNVARRLRPEGVFVLEVFVPDLTRFTDQQTSRAVNLEENQIQLDASRHDPVYQQVMSQYIFLTEEGLRFYPEKLRCAWPSELV